MAKTETPWGRAELVEELIVKQQAGERRFASVVQLLETERGERLVRFAYSTGGVARRFDERGEDERSVGRAEQRIDGVLRVGHQSQHVAALVADAGDVVDGAVARLAVAQDNLTVCLELAHELRRREPAAVAVLDGDHDALPDRAA